MINGVQIKKLNIFQDDRGLIYEVARNAEPMEIKQTTYTESFPGTIKAFHWHRKQTDLWHVVRGFAQVVLYDLREDSPTHMETQVIYASEKNPITIKIPNGVAHGYKVLGTEKVGLFYHTSEKYNHKNPDEERTKFDDPIIAFDWRTENK